MYIYSYAFGLIKRYKSQQVGVQVFLTHYHQFVSYQNFPLYFVSVVMAEMKTWPELYLRT